MKRNREVGVVCGLRGAHPPRRVSDRIIHRNGGQTGWTTVSDRPNEPVVCRALTEMKQFHTRCQPAGNEKRAPSPFATLYETRRGHGLRDFASSSRAFQRFASSSRGQCSFFAVRVLPSAFRDSTPQCFAFRAFAFRASCPAFVLPRKHTASSPDRLLPGFLEPCVPCAAGE